MKGYDFFSHNLLHNVNKFILLLIRKRNIKKSLKTSDTILRGKMLSNFVVV